mmetsp:Transcript_9854/g.19195  ORF Transcript_9854/g.19195 Transcript_9854/m.19195 type:complete len:359 (-) Transcript_9854:183-1259(-)
MSIVAEAARSGREVSPFLITSDDLALDSGAAYPTIGLVRVLFPDGMGALEKVLQSAGIPLVEMLNPPWMLSQCSEPRLDITGAGLAWSGTEITHLRNPLLLPHQAFGAAIALGCMFAFAQRVPPASKWSKKRTLAHWATACFWYTVMSVSSFLAHNVFEPRTGSWEFFWTIDAASTGLSSINLAVGAIFVLMTGSPSLPTSPYVVILLNCVACILGRHFAVATSIPFRHELLYLAPAAMAGVALSPALVVLTVRDPDARHGMLWYHVFALGVILAPLMDQMWCAMLGDMSFGAIHQVFLFCGLMVGAAMHGVLSVTMPISTHISIRKMQSAAGAVSKCNGAREKVGPKSRRAAAKKSR